MSRIRAPSGVSRAHTRVRARRGAFGTFRHSGRQLLRYRSGMPRGSPIPPLDVRHMEKEPRRIVPLGLHGGHSGFNGSPSSSLPSPVQTPEGRARLWRVTGAPGGSFRRVLASSGPVRPVQFVPFCQFSEVLRAAMTPRSAANWLRYQRQPIFSSSQGELPNGHGFSCLRAVSAWGGLPSPDVPSEFSFGGFLAGPVAQAPLAVPPSQT